MTESNKYNLLAGPDTRYVDDFDVANNFMRILFNPSRAVQARELTQLQTILHNQNKELSNHIFRNNTIIDGAQISFKRNQAAAFIDPFFVLNPFPDFSNNESYFAARQASNQSIIGRLNFSLNAWRGMTFGNGIPSHLASYVDSVSGHQESTKQITIQYVDFSNDLLPIIYYEYSGLNVLDSEDENEKQRLETNGEVFYPLLANSGFPSDRNIPIFGIRIMPVDRVLNATQGKMKQPFNAMVASVESGVVYARDHFLHVEPTEIIVSNTPDEGIVQIGFDIEEDVVTEENMEQVPADRLDPTDDTKVSLGTKLRDPAFGSRNFNAPGAHRYRIKPVFTSKQSETIDQKFDNFEPFIVMEDGVIIKDQTDVKYGDIMKMLARRTHDQSGNWTLEDFDISLIPDPKDDDKFIAEIGPGKAYVEGYEINKLTSTPLSIPRARSRTHEQFFDSSRKSINNFPRVRLRSNGASIDAGVFSKDEDETIEWFRIGRNEKVQILNCEVSARNPYRDSQNRPITERNVIGEARIISIDQNGLDTTVFFDDLSSLGDDAITARSIRTIRNVSGKEHVVWANFDLQFSVSGVRPAISGGRSPLLIDLGSRITKDVEDCQYNVVRRHTFTAENGTAEITRPSGTTTGEFYGRRPIVAVYPLSNNSNILNTEDSLLPRASNFTTNHSWNSATFGVNVFAALGVNQNNNNIEVIFSNDGETWSHSDFPQAGGINPNHIHYVSGPVIKEDEEDDGYVLREFWVYGNNEIIKGVYDGETINWRTENVNITLAGEPEWITRHSPDDENNQNYFWAFVEGTTEVAYSFDGEAWQPVAVSTGSNRVITGITYSSRDDRWVVVGRNTSSTAGYVWTAQGDDIHGNLNWQEVQFSTPINDCTTSSGVYVVVGDNGFYARGTQNANGDLEWNSSSTLGNSNLTSIVHDGFRFTVVGGSPAVVFSSEDGIDWEQNTSTSRLHEASNTSLNSIAFGNRTFVIVGDNNVILSTNRSPSNMFFVDLNRIEYEPIAPNDNKITIHNLPMFGQNSMEFEAYISYAVDGAGPRRSKTLRRIEIPLSVGGDSGRDSKFNEFEFQRETPQGQIEYFEDCYDVVDIYQLTNHSIDEYNDPEPDVDLKEGYLRLHNYPDKVARRLTPEEKKKLIFHDGQTPLYYDKGKMTGWKYLWSSDYKNTANAETQYVIVLRYFEHGSGDYFTVNSYGGISDFYKPTTEELDLRRVPLFRSKDFGQISLVNSIDFRRKLSDLQSSNEHNSILPSTSVIVDYTVYNHYKVKVFLDKHGEFRYTSGIPSSKPDLPKGIDGAMHLCTLTVPSYTFSAKDIEIDLVKNTRYTMQDIRKLENRIVTVEDMVSLSLLEQNAFDMKIVDNESGLDRFKSGIFVDNFESLGHANTYYTDFYLSVNSVGAWGQCPTEEKNIPIVIDRSNISGDIQEYENLVTLKPSGARLLASNPTASGTMNVNPLLFYVWHGQVKLNPAVDTWHETKWLPQRNVTVGSHKPPPGFNPNWDTARTEVRWVGVDGELQTITEGNNVNISASGGFREIDKEMQVQADVLKAGMNTILNSGNAASSRWSGRIDENNRVVYGNEATDGLWTNHILLRSPDDIQRDFDAGEYDWVVRAMMAAGEESAAKWGVDLHFDPRTMFNTAIIGLRNSGFLDGGDIEEGDWRRFDEDGNFIGARGVSVRAGEVTHEQVIATLQAVGWENNSTSAALLGSTNLNAHGVPADIAEAMQNDPLMAERLAEAGQHPADIDFSGSGGTRGYNQNLHAWNTGAWAGTNFEAIDSIMQSGSTDRHTFDSAAEITRHIQTRDVLHTHTKKTSDTRLISRTEIPWMRPRNVRVEGHGFRPGMNVYAFLDNKKVKFIPDDDYKDSKGNPRVNADGKIEGHFSIPPMTFTTGQKQFVLTDDPEESTSQGSTTYTARGILNTKQKTITTIRSVSVSQETRFEETAREVDFGEGVAITNIRQYHDPIAQSFFIPTEGGCFLRSISVYFATRPGDFRNRSGLEQIVNPNGTSLDTSGYTGASLNQMLDDIYGETHPKDPLTVDSNGYSRIMNAAITLYLVEVIDGNPTQNIVPMSMVVKYPEEINRNPFIPSKGETEFVFNDPIYLEEGAEYAFVLISPSKEYEVWYSELGQQDIFEGGRNEPGVGIAEQPYLGTMFKSQNSRTWTPMQEKTLTFKIHRNEYNTGTGYDIDLIDSKNDDATDEPLYPYTIDDPNWNGDPNLVKCWLSSVLPMIGEMILPNTSIEYKQRFETGTESGSEFSSGTGADSWLGFKNNTRNQLYNESPGASSDEFAISRNSTYRIRCTLQTSKPNLTPVLDKDQMRVIAARNLVKGIEPDFRFSRSQRFDVGVQYQRNDIIEDEETGDQYFVCVNGFTVDEGQSIEYYVNENMIKILPESVHVNMRETNTEETIGNSGVYVSQNVRLANPADDLRLIIDTSEPMSNYVEFYYRILDSKPMYTTLHPHFHASENLIDHNSQIYYMIENPNDVEPGKEIKFETISSRKRENYINISGLTYEENLELPKLDDPDSKERRNATVAYVNGVTTPDIFDTEILKNRIPFCIDSEAFHEIARKRIPVHVWDPNSKYRPGDLVWYDGAFWVSQGEITERWDKMKDYVVGEIVESSMNLYIAAKDITGNVMNQNPEEGLNDDWVWMDNSPNFFSVGTVPSDSGTAWSRLPALFFASPIERKPSGEWRRMILRNSRAKVNNYRDDDFYESVWVPEVNPNMEFRAFSLKAELKNVNTRAFVPRIKNIRAIATL